MTEQTTNRRAEDKNMQVLATKIEGLAQDITEMRQSVIKMADAFVKFAVIEERQTNTIMAQDRITVTLDRLNLRLDAHEKSCVIQEKELRAPVTWSVLPGKAQSLQPKRWEAVRDDGDGKTYTKWSGA